MSGAVHEAAGEAAGQALSISERITEGMGIETVFTIHAFGLDIQIGRASCRERV